MYAPCDRRDEEKGFYTMETSAPDGFDEVVVSFAEDSDYGDSVERLLADFGLKDYKKWKQEQVIRMPSRITFDIFPGPLPVPNALMNQSNWQFKYTKLTIFNGLMQVNNVALAKLCEWQDLNDDICDAINKELPPQGSLILWFLGRDARGQMILPGSLARLGSVLTDFTFIGDSLIDISALSGLERLDSLSLFMYRSPLTDLSPLSCLAGLERLDLSGCISLTDLSALAGLTGLKTLKLSKCGSLTDLSGLAGLAGLETLHLSECESLADLSGLAGLTGLKTLKLSDCKALTDVSGLAGLTGLKTLNLSECKALTDVSGLAGISGLQSLSLEKCDALTDLSALAGLAGLETLSMVKCDAISDLSPLAGLTGLKSLRRDDCCDITDLSPLGGLTGLRSLTLDYCYSSTHLCFLAGITGLETFKVESCHALTDLAGFAGLTGLRTLSLGYCPVLTDLSALAGLTGLKTLNLPRCEALTDISPLAGLAGLERLDLSGCTSLTDLSGLAGLTGLKTLNLPRCEALTYISPLAGLAGLETLNLSDCKALTNVSGLAGLASLITLNLSDCKALTDISGLAGLASLITLNLSDCKVLTDVSGLAGLAGLETLDLSECEALTDLLPLAGLSRLRTLNLSGCKKVPDLTPLAGLPCLKSLNLWGCRSLTELTPLNCIAGLEYRDTGGHDVRVPATAVESPAAKGNQPHGAMFDSTAQAFVTGKSRSIDLGNGVMLDMAWIPPGTFMMGSPASGNGCYNDDPQHRMEISDGYWIGAFAVTLEQWHAVMGANNTPGSVQATRRIVARISWHDCQAFIRKLSEMAAVGVHASAGAFRLPTEAEWEYACRAGTTGDYAVATDDLVREGDDKNRVTGQAKPNAWGLWDMHQSVQEWCLDWYGDYSEEASKDPLGGGVDWERVVRGGWSAARGSARPRHKSGITCMRLAFGPPPPGAGMMTEARFTRIFVTDHVKDVILNGSVSKVWNKVFRCIFDILEYHGYCPEDMPHDVDSDISEIFTRRYASPYSHLFKAISFANYGEYADEYPCLTAVDVSCYFSEGDYCTDDDCLGFVVRYLCSALNVQDYIDHAEESVIVRYSADPEFLRAMLCWLLVEFETVYRRMDKEECESD